jgi:alpha-tubulin suppressor-like RCC1 family protein
MRGFGRHRPSRHGTPRALIALVVATSAVLVPAFAGITSAQAAPYTATAWGLNSSGQLGDGTTAGPEKCGTSQEACSTTPVAVSGLSGVSAVAAGTVHSLALLEDGTVKAWGENNSGQLGDGTNNPSDVPVAVSGLSGVVAIAAGSGHSLALLEDGTVRAWGANGEGQLGDGNETNSDVPVQVSGLSHVKAIAAGADFSLALLEDGTVMGWGNDSSGQLGDGHETTTNVPVAVSGLSGAVAIAAGASDGVALLENGTVKAWGENAQGQLGNGSTTSSDVPVAVSGLSGVSAISAGGRFNLALLGDGTVKSWGGNGDGELGDGTSTGPEMCGEPPTLPCAKTPVAVSGLSGVSAIAAGEHHALALLGSGALVAWGNNGRGELGDGTSTGPEVCGPFATPCSTTPVAVDTQGVSAGMSAGSQHSLAFGPPPSPLPELGRCVKLAGHTGRYTRGNCVEQSAGHEGRYEWEPGPGAKPNFTATATSLALEVSGGPKLVCGSSALDGEWTGAKTAAVNLHLTGCEALPEKRKCQSNPSSPGEISTSQAAAGSLGLIVGGLHPKAGLDLKPKSPSPSLVSFTCGGPPEAGSGELWSVQGSVIGAIRPVDAMRMAFALRFQGARGKQSPERLEGGITDTLVVERLAGTEKLTAGAVLTLRDGTRHLITSENEEALEIKAK